MSANGPLGEPYLPYAGHGGETGLVPQGLDDAAIAPFVGLTLSSLSLLGGQQAVRQYTESAPDAHRAILELSAAVAAAGVRVRDTGKVRDEFLQTPRLFTDEEIWLINLAIDVIAMLSTHGGLAPNIRAQMISDVRCLDDEVHAGHWKRAVRKAGDGPPAFRELRAHIPQHQPHPG